ncbi:ComEC/Rec2 family competence protein [Tumidithrix elongata RA019]|uniref:ComEC/Rec2 family competence protein n=1 Tax=Tumidithrix elongata BACA0141 TaxID=2716417 RepID=A0AAW9Q561_9CYAN|nr:ComEC/Rec2 family competence protein [Tumidithrix elongata RA019]
MNVLIGLIFCLAFILGAYTSVIPGWLGETMVLGVGFAIAMVVPLIWRKAPKRWVWLVAAAIAGFASFYVQFRTPQPQSDDISKFAPASNVAVQGKLLEPPSLTRSDRARLILEVQGINQQVETSEPQEVFGNAQNETKPKPKVEPKFEQASGNLYVTVALIQATGLRVGQSVEITGRLYLPSGANNPTDFDFKNYLKRQGVFAGLSGRMLIVKDRASAWGEWWIKSRMVRAHVTGAGMPQGALLSSLVLGNRAVDLPTDLKDTFIQAGLAAVLAASGFQVSLLLGAVLLLSRDRSPKQQFIQGCICLFAYAMLTGASPSVLRAVVMGLGSLVGILTQRRSRPIVGLAIAAVILLLYQPLWIWDLGFQFSFLATLGLVATVEPITKRLEWLPPLVAAAVAVPIAAYIWTLPLQLYNFGKISPYSVLANLLTTPLVSFATIGGMISGILGAIFIPFGAAISWFMIPPLHFTIAIAKWTNTLPGAATNVGTISLWQLLVGYGLILMIWLVPWLSKRWILGIVLTLILIFIPNGIARATQLQVTILSAGEVPVMLIQNQGQTILINSGDRQVATFTLLPMLQKVGINQIDWAISTDPQLAFSEGWKTLLDSAMPIKQFRDAGVDVYPKPYQDLIQALSSSNTNIKRLQQGESVEFSPNLKLEVVNASPSILRLVFQDTSWLLFGDTDLKAQQLLVDYSKPDTRKPQDIDPDPKVQQLLAERRKILSNLKSTILFWGGGKLMPEILQAIRPTVAIASANSVVDETVSQIYGIKIRLYWTGKDGAVQWTPENEIQTLKDQQDSRSPI